MRWIVQLVKGRQFFGGTEVGDILDRATGKLVMPSSLSKTEIARRAFEAGRRVGPITGGATMLVPIVGEVD